MSTILDMQPRQSGGGGGKSSDDIVYELADSIMSRVMEKLELENARPDLFEVTKALKLSLYKLTV